MLGVFYSLAGEKNSLEIFLATWETPFSNPSAPPLSSFFSYPTYISYQNDESDFYGRLILRWSDSWAVTYVKKKGYIGERSVDITNGRTVRLIQSIFCLLQLVFFVQS